MPVWFFNVKNKKGKAYTSLKLLMIFVLLISFFTPTNQAKAASGTWNGTSGSNWSNAAIWTGGIIADGIDSTASFVFNITSAASVVLDTIRTIGNITFTDSTTASHDLTISGANTLTLDTSSGSPTINVTNRTLTISSPIAGADGLTKSGAGTLWLTGNNSFTGGINLSAGILQIDSASNANAFGNSSNVITFTGNATLYNSNNTFTMAQGITINPGITGTMLGAFGEVLNVNGPLTGSGAMTISSGSNGWDVRFLNSSNTFTGPISFTGSNGTARFTSLADSANSITMANGASTIFEYSGSTPLVLANRPIVMGGGSGSATIQSSGSGSNTITINQNLSVPSAGSKTLILAGVNTGTNTFAGNIVNGSGTIALNKAGTGNWLLSGTNTYTGNTLISAGGGRLTFQGVQSMPSGGTTTLNQFSSASAAVALLADGGTNNFPTTIALDNRNSSTQMAMTVGNTSAGNGGTGGGTTTNATTSINKLSYITAQGPAGAGGLGTLAINNGYTLSIGSVSFAANANVVTNWSCALPPAGGAVLITGDVQQDNGNTATTKNVIFNLGGTSTGNIISGSIKDAADYTNLSNPNAMPLAILKNGTSTWTLSGANTYTGTTTISAGTLDLSGGSAIVDTGSVVMGNVATAILKLSSNETIGSITGGGATGGNVNLQSNTLTVNNSGAASYDGIMSGAGGLTKSNSGTLTLSRAQTYTGTTSVTAGTLAITAATVPASNTWDVSISSSSTKGLMTLPANPNLTGKTINISSTAVDNNYSTDLVTWTGTATGTPTLKLNGTTVTSGTFVGNDKITFNANAITYTRGTPPTAPTSLIATSGNAEVSLSWTAPGPGDTPISDYVVEYKTTASPTWSIFAEGVSTSTSAVVTGLVNGTSYDFRVSAVNAAGQGTASTVASATPLTTPSAPTSIVATRGNGEASIAFTPSADGGSPITGFTVTSNPGGFTGTGASSPIVVTGLTNGTSYTFTVTATNIVGEGPASVASNSVIPATVPDAPTAFSATVGNAEISLLWSAPVYDGGTAITDYVVEYKTTISPTWSIFADGTSTNTNATVTGLTNGTSYDFRVYTVNDVGQSSASSVASATPITVPDAPTIGTATRGNTEVSVTFTPPISDGGSSITSYTVTSNPGGLTETGTLSPIVVTGLTNGTSYTFTVTATNAAGTGASSVASNSVTPATIPDAPTSLIATAGQGEVDLSWDAPAWDGGDTLTDYVVEYKLTISPTWSIFADGTSTNTIATVTGLTNGEFYDFRISAVNTVGQSSPSIDASAKPVTVPDAPTIGTATPGNAQASVTFTPPVFDGGTPISSYTVTSNPGGFTGTGTSSPIVVTGLTNGTSYTFTVTATNAVGESSASSASNAVIPVTVPGAPINVSAAEGNTEATITFDPPVSDGGTAITSYTVTSSPGGFTGTGASSPIVVTGLTNGTTYSFTVTATNAVGEGSSSAVSNSVTLSTEPDIPVNLASTVLGSSVGLSWSAPALNGGKPIVDYIVEYQLTTGGTWSVFAEGVSIGTTAIVTGLSNDTSYDFRVRAVNIIGQSAPSATVSATPGEPAQVLIQSFPDVTNPSIATAVRITNEGAVQYEYQYTWCVTDSDLNVCGGGDDVFSSGAAKLIQPLENWDFNAASTVQDPGNYWFHINVTYGSETSTAHQSFTAVPTFPDAPIIGTAVFGNSQATINFTPPVSNGGATITNYTVTSGPGGFTGTGASSPIVVTGLTNGTSYTFTVTATNIVGEGPASAASNSVTPATIPDAPTGLVASPGNTQVGLSWVAPIYTGGIPIIDYIVEYKLDSDLVWQVFADGVSTNTTTLITGLTNDVGYNFRVRAVNNVGQSLENSANANPNSPSRRGSRVPVGTVNDPVVTPPSTTPPITTKPNIPVENKKETPTSPIEKVIDSILPEKGVIIPITSSDPVVPTENSVIAIEDVPKIDSWGIGKWVALVLGVLVIISFSTIVFLIRRNKEKEKLYYENLRRMHEMRIRNQQEHNGERENFGNNDSNNLMQ